MRKLVIRTDDVGYTRAHNMGTWEVYEHGYATHCEIMLESPATVEALQSMNVNATTIAISDLNRSRFFISDI